MSSVVPDPAATPSQTANILNVANALTVLRLLLVPVFAELTVGNIHLLLGAAIVAGFRWPWLWALPLLTKVSPGIGLLWFVLRREWGNLVIALGATAAIAAVSYVTIPDAWPRWFEVIVANAGKGGTWASVPIPLLVRLPAAVALVVWGARSDRRWTVPVASMLALPALWYGGISMLLAVIPLLAERQERRQPAA